MDIQIDQIITEMDKDNSSHSAIKRISKHFFGGHCPKLYVITPYWHATLNDMSMRILKKRILKAGCSCLIYQFPAKILSDNVSLTEKYFKDIQAEIKKDISYMKEKYSFKEIIVLGISLGCVNALMVANGHKDVNKIILVVPGDSLSESLWKGIGTKKLKEHIKEHKINLIELEKDWQDLDPKNNIGRLDGKNIEIYLSRADHVIPYTNGNHLVRDMKDIGLIPVVFKNNKLGHYLTPLKFIITKKF